MPNCNGITALVTGASRGIGRAAALAQAGGGAQILVHYGRNAAEAKAVVEQIRSSGSRAEAIGADLSTPKGPVELARKARDPARSPHRAGGAKACSTWSGRRQPTFAMNPAWSWPRRAS